MPGRYLCGRPAGRCPDSIAPCRARAAGSASAINTYAYSSIDRVFEYTVLIERGSDFQTTKVLAKRSGTTVNATQYAVMYSNNLLAQLDVLIISGEVRLYASPEPGVSGTLSYRIKREVM